MSVSYPKSNISTHPLKFEHILPRSKLLLWHLPWSSCNLYKCSESSSSALTFILPHYILSFSMVTHLYCCPYINAWIQCMHWPTCQLVHTDHQMLSWHNRIHGGVPCEGDFLTKTSSLAFYAQQLSPSMMKDNQIIVRIWIHLCFSPALSEPALSSGLVAHICSKGCNSLHFSLTPCY